MTLTGQKKVLGPGAEPPEAQGSYTLNCRQTSIFSYLIYDTGRSRIGVGFQGAEPQEAQGFLAINYGQMSIFLYLICDTGVSRIGVGSRRRSTRRLRGVRHLITFR